MVVPVSSSFTLSTHAATNTKKIKILFVSNDTYYQLLEMSKNKNAKLFDNFQYKPDQLG